MRTTFHVLTFLVLSAVVLSGCKSKNKIHPGTYGEETLVMPEVTGDDAGALTGDSFADRERVTDVTLAPVYFGYDSFQLAPEIAKVEQAADHLNQNASHVMIVEGNCDERGSNEYNLSLGEQRALAIRGYLVNLGISADRIQSRSFGEEKPAVDGHDESAWRMNRRGEFAIYK